MNYKKIIVAVIVFLTVIISFGSVSASDSADNLTAIDGGVDLDVVDAPVDGGVDLDVVDAPVDDNDIILSEDNNSNDSTVLSEGTVQITVHQDVYYNWDSNEEFIEIELPSHFNGTVNIVGKKFESSKSLFYQELRDFSGKISISPKNVDIRDLNVATMGISINVYDYNSGLTYSKEYPISYLGDSFKLTSGPMRVFYTVSNTIWKEGDAGFYVEYYIDGDVTGTVAILLNGTELYNRTVGFNEYKIVSDLNIYDSELGQYLLDYGNYVLEFRYSGDGNYEGFSEYRNLTVTYNLGIYLDGDYMSLKRITYNEPAIFNIQFPRGATGYVICNVNGKEFIVQSSGGKQLMVDSKDFVYGINNVTITYVGDDFPLKTVYDQFSCLGVVKFDSEIDFDESLNFSLQLPEDALGNLKIYEVISGNLNLLTQVSVVNGFANTVIPLLAMGRHLIYPEFEGNYEIALDTDVTDYTNMYYSYGVSVTPKVIMPENVGIDELTGAYVFWKDGNYNITIKVPNDITELEVIINDEERTFEVAEGILTFEVFNLNAHETYTYDYYSNIYYSFSSYWGHISILIKQDNPEAKVSPGLSVSVNNITFGDDVIVNVSLNEKITGYIPISIGESNYTVHVENGKGSLTISNLSAGNYEVRAFFDGNDLFLDDENSTSFVVNKANSTLDLNGFSFDYGGSGSTNVLFADATGINVSVIDHSEAVIKINGNYITLSGLNAGTYTLKVSTIVDANHNTVVKTATVKVNKLNTVLSAAKVTTTYGTSKKFVVTLKDSKGKLLSGKKVTIKIAGKTLSAKTNSGKATFTLPTNLAVKTHTVSITFAGDSNYNKKVVSLSKVVVTKATPKVVAAKKAYALAVKTKVYTVTLKSDKNKAIAKGKVTLRVNCKNYIAYTNSKGIATFKLTNLNKKGTFKAIVKFAGNANFKAVSANTNIIVK